MRRTLILDDDLVRTAQALTGTTDLSDMLHEALQALIAQESARALAVLGGTMPELKNVPRRKTRPGPPDRRR